MLGEVLAAIFRAGVSTDSTQYKEKPVLAVKLATTITKASRTE
jgi:hypothetical protein